MATNANGSVQLRAANRVFPAAANIEDDDDTISLTSTVPEEVSSDTEYVVEGVRAENSDGSQVLVEWSNFPLDQCTWEPINNLPQELRDTWEQTKKDQDPSVAVAFKQKYEAARKEKEYEALQRHRRRNAKRKKLGQPTTRFRSMELDLHDSGDELESAGETPTGDIPDDVSDDSEFAEAEEDDAIDHTAVAALEPPSSRSKTQKTTRPPNRIFTFKPDSAVSKEKTKASSQQTLPKPPKSPALGRMPAPNHASRDREKPAKSGYQGSARKSSVSSALPSRPGSVAVSKVATAPKAATTAKTANTAKAAVAAPLTAPEVVKKSFKAKKTGQQTAINIFSEGKVRKQRQGIGDIEVDSGRQGKLYNKHQYRRKAELRSRGKEDQAPDIEKVATSLFAPGSAAATSNAQGPLQRQNTGETHEDNDAPSVMREEAAMQSITAMSPTRAGRADSTTNQLPKSALASPTIASSAFQKSKRGSLSLEKDRPKKKTKSVRFTEANDEPSPVLSDKGGDLAMFTDTDAPLVSEPMEIDVIHDSIHDAIVRSPSIPPARAKRMSLSTYKSTNLQRVGKQIRLSTAPYRSLDVNFDNIPRDADQEWVTEFLADDQMVFGHTVLAETLTSQLKSPGSEGFQWLRSGAITSINDVTYLENIAEHLRVLSSGLFKTNSQYHLLVFPTKCDDFQELADFGINPSSPDGVALKYFMFKSEQPICQLIRPFSDTSDRDMSVDAGKEKMLLFPMLLDMQFSSLIKGPRQDRKKRFFLAFPEASIEWFKSICSWLFVRDPSCKIYSNSEPGGWSAFIANSRPEYGIVILHEAMVPFIRRFPSLARLLYSNSNFNFWCFSETLGLETIQADKRKFIPSMPTMFSRLFPLGKAILITPSFMVSEPQQTLAFLKWFQNQARRSSNNKLVVAYNIREYARDLSGEKSAQLQLKNTVWKHMNPMDVAKQKNDTALTDDDLQARQESWLRLNNLCTDQVESEVPFSELNNVIFADESISPYDEQSLVNWFGWWSLTYSDQFRKFSVIGSSSSPRSTATRMSQIVKIPKYDQSVVNDPDEAIRSALRNSGKPAEASNQPRGTGRPHGSENWFQSQCFKNMDSNIKPFLAQLDYRLRGHMKLYNTPVSWADITMADYFGDHHTQFSTIEQWWKFASPWLSAHFPFFNTYVGFFYTIKEEWSPDKFPAGLNPRRHPWFVIYRPVDPHDKKTGYRHGKTELIVWDVRAGDELEDTSSTDLSQLTWMQQELIRYIQLHAHEKNPGSILERVWLGGFQMHQSKCLSTLAADITAEFFTTMSENLKSALPGAARFLAANGYRQVSLHPKAATAPSTTSRAGNIEQSGARDNEEDDLDPHIIFHPPRGSGQLKPRGSSKCTNDLFEAARLTRLRDMNAKEMSYTFRPTMEWYQQQVDEGRQYEHIMVDGWQKTFELFEIPQGRKDPSSSTSENSPAPWAPRQDSVGSNHSSPS